MNTVKIPRILLPADADMSLWAVNACDQFTSDYAYWARVEELTRGAVSAYNLIYPEIYLKDEPEKRIKRIEKTMRDYLSGGVFKSVDGLILVERTTAAGTRTGIVLAIDLEDYSFEEGTRAPVRSTEATILERIPPRVKIRENAPLELPHAMLLYDDGNSAVLGACERGEVLYDFELMMGGGRVKGTLIKNPEKVKDELYAAAKGGMLFAVGDGNHSLATAKTCWENIKKTLSPSEYNNHPARYALAEAVNIYDPALNFEPIHRLVKTERADEFIDGLKTFGGNSAYIVRGGKKIKTAFADDIPDGIRALDAYIAEFTKNYGGEVDYIHGEKELKELTADKGVGVLLPPIAKDSFFSLIRKGVLPRKTFSMGEGCEKRYYIEARLIK